MADEALTGEAIAERVTQLGHSLRARGVEVALAEIIDAARAATLVDLGSRSEFRVALRATLVKDARHLALFDAVFDRLFPLSVSDSAAGGGAAAIDAAGVLAFDADPAALAARLVAEHGGFDGELRGERHHLQRALRAADLAQLMSDARKANPELPTAELRERLKRLKRLMAAEVLEAISRRCRAVYWLNPEPRRQWGTHDSEMEVYARHCTDTFEVRTVRQLVYCVERLL